MSVSVICKLQVWFAILRHVQWWCFHRLKFALLKWKNYLLVVFRRRVYVSLGSWFHLWSYFYKLNQTRRTSVYVGLSVLPVVECVAPSILFVFA